MPRGSFNTNYYYKRNRRAVRKKYKRYMSTGLIYAPSNKVIKVKIRGSFGVSSNASGEIAGIWNNDPSGYTDFTGVSTLYDAYKITGIKAHYIPTLPNDTSTVTGYWPLYLAVDQNDAVAPTNVATMLDYDNMVVKNMYKPWKIYRRVYNQSGVSGTTVFNGGYKPTTITTATAGIKYYGNGFDLTTAYGQVIVTLYMKVRERR